MSISKEIQGASDQTTRLSSAGLSDEAGFDYWHSIAGSTYRFHGLKKGERRFRFESTMRTVGDIVLSDFVATPSVKSRESSAIRRDGRPYLKIRQFVSGDGATVVHDGRSFRLKQGGVHLIDQSRDVTEFSSGDHQYNMFVSHEQIGFDRHSNDACISFLRGTPAGAMLDTACRNLFPAITSADSEEVARKTHDLVALIRIILAGGADSEAESTVSFARRQCVLRHIAENLSDPELTPAGFVRALGFSRATLYRDFADEGGLERLILNCRLERAFDRLSRARPQRGTVDRIAIETGFKAIHHFSNAFLRQFRMRPSEVVGMYLERDQAAEHTFPDHEKAQAPAEIRQAQFFFEVARGDNAWAQSACRSS